MSTFKNTAYILILVGLLFYTACKSVTKKAIQEEKKQAYLVTFIEMGSVRCVPCQMMQPVMRSIKEKYGDKVNVVFYDVWTPEGRPYAQQYGIQSIPTQVFLDENGKEFFRHEGYLPEEELVKVLNKKWVR